MIITNDMAKNNFGEYSNKNTKLSREVRDGKLFKIFSHYNIGVIFFRK